MDRRASPCARVRPGDVMFYSYTGAPGTARTMRGMSRPSNRLLIRSSRPQNLGRQKRRGSSVSHKQRGEDEPGGPEARMSMRKPAQAVAFEVTAEINVTPMIDVMLVLLIIFMVVTPAVTAAALPTARTAQYEPGKHPTLVIDAKGRVSLAVRNHPEAHTPALCARGWRASTPPGPATPCCISRPTAAWPTRACSRPSRTRAPPGCPAWPPSPSSRGPTGGTDASLRPGDGPLFHQGQRRRGWRWAFRPARAWRRTST